MQKAAFIVLTITAIAGCSEVTGTDGRFQGFTGETRFGGAGAISHIYILDTRTGDVRVCAFTTSLFTCYMPTTKASSPLGPDQQSQKGADERINSTPPFDFDSLPDLDSLPMEGNR